MAMLWLRLHCTNLKIDLYAPDTYKYLGSTAIPNQRTFYFEARGWRICVHFIVCKPSIGRRAENLHVKPIQGNTQRQILLYDW